MHILCLTDYPFISGKWLWRYLPDHHDDLDFICSSTNILQFLQSKQLSYLIGDLKQVIIAGNRIRQKHYDVVVAWENKNGFPFALYKRLVGHASPPLIILSFGNRGLPSLLPGLMRFVMPSVEAITVPSAIEAQTCAHQLGVLSERIYVCHNAVLEFPRVVLYLWAASSDIPSESYIFSGGYSYRDFGTLIQAMNGLPISLRNVAPRSFIKKLGVGLPSNVFWEAPLPQSRYIQLMAFAKIVVIPLRKSSFSVGLMDLLYAMALAKPIIVTNTAGISEYVTDRQEGLLVSPGDSNELRISIQYLLDHPEDCRQLGMNARKKFEQNFTYKEFANRAYKIICRVAEDHSSLS